MTPLQKYAQIINEIFGEGTTKFSIDKNYDNRILTALHRNSGGQSGFANNFIERLKRLKTMYSEQPEDLTTVLEAVNNIANKNWQGAFAELSAFDHLNTEIICGKSFFSSSIKTKQILDASLSLAQNYGQKISDLDGFIDEYGVYFDVKCLKDNIKEILQGIYSEVFSYYGITSLNIMPEYPSDSSYLEFQSKRNDHRTGLNVALNIETKPKYIQSTVITGLSYRIIWTPGVNQTVSFYCPLCTKSFLSIQI